MIIYGTNGSKGQIIQTAETCPSCGQSQTIVIAPYHRYFHLFWIPIFPIGKEYAIGCEACGHIIDKKDFHFSSEINSHIKAPKWHFIGLFLIIALFAYFIIDHTIEEKSNKSTAIEYISTPAVGDVYEFYLKESKEYSLMKVVEIEDDTICVVFNEYATTKKSGLENLKDKYSNNYENDIYMYSKGNLLELLEDKVLLKINR